MSGSVCITISDLSVTYTELQIKVCTKGRRELVVASHWTQYVYLVVLHDKRKHVQCVVELTSTLVHRDIVLGVESVATASSCHRQPMAAEIVTA
jgi:hypothetical protein